MQTLIALIVYISIGLILSNAESKLPNPNLQIYGKEADLREADIAMCLIDNCRKFLRDSGANTTVPSALLSLYDTNYLNDETIYFALSLLKRQFGANSQNFFIVNPLLRDSVPKEKIERIKKKYSDAKHADLILMAYNADSRAHWLLLVYDARNKIFFVADSLKRLHPEDYVKDVSVFAFILREYFGLNSVPEPMRPVERVEISSHCYLLIAGDSPPKRTSTVTSVFKVWKNAWQQEDYFNCGIFSILFASYFMQNPQVLTEIAADSDIEPPKIIPTAGLIMREYLFMQLASKCYRKDPTMEFPECIEFETESNANDVISVAS